MIRRKIALCVIAMLAAVGTNANAAKQTRHLNYRYNAIWSAAIRLIRVDFTYPVTDKDKDNGFILFVYPGRGKMKKCHASLEFIDLTKDAKRPEVRLAIQIADQPAYIAVAFLDKLERKLHNERGRPQPTDDDDPQAPSVDEDARDEPEDDEDNKPIYKTPR